MSGWPHLEVVRVIAQAVADRAGDERRAAGDAEHRRDLGAALTARVDRRDVGPLAAFLVGLGDGVRGVVRVEREPRGARERDTAADREVCRRDLLAMTGVVANRLRRDRER